ncbi:hypothetical protein LOTGIDRAFT_210470 [Lottia gigantea]|uniref:Uncharacterized protein n=1 Tax=Lottia gigantea TaxID=225164 RepID=V4A1C9_LOTGI|nr:hypothetical protein LOTGIDRAFT_210470 [Lottia gigantea]ESO87096.1 hypothetical protein LOTGIDRAFT_210470 [Lottia gigantea]
MSSIRQEQAEKEERQKKHYKMLNELQNMARELPAKFQQRLPYDLLSSLADSLIDSTVFDIVHSLEEVQHLEEKAMCSSRSRMVSEHKAQSHVMQKKHKELLLECENRPHNLPLVQSQIDRELEMIKKRHDDEVRKRDMKIILELDQKAMEQQNLLEKAGVPGFYVTNNKLEMRLQMYLLEFINRMSRSAQEGLFNS